jgi:hypothetical protein
MYMTQLTYAGLLSIQEHGLEKVSKLKPDKHRACDTVNKRESDI